MKKLPILCLLLQALTIGILPAQTNPTPAPQSLSPLPNPQSTVPSTFWQASVTAETGGDYATALNQLTAYQQAGGDEFLTQLRAGWLYYLKQDYTNAAKSYAEAERLQPSAINPLLGLLAVAKAQGNEAALQQAVDSVLHIDPLNYRAQMTGAEQSFKAKNYTKALSGYRRVLAYYPDDLDARSGKAWALFYLGDRKNAAADFQLLLGVSSDYRYARQGLDLCMEKTTH